MSDNTIAQTAIDMSPAAISQRLRDVAQLYQLGCKLTKAKPVTEHGRR